MIKLCSQADILDNQAKGFDIEGKRIFIVHKQNQFYAYQNNCPHANWPLNINPNVFLDFDRKYIQCSNHMALFEIETGKCISGPCTGDRLTPSTIKIVDGDIWFVN